MSSILYILESQELKSKLKDSLNVFLRSMDAMKFNAEHTISIEGWDVLTFLDISHEYSSDILVKHAPYKFVKLINMSHLSNAVVQLIMRDYIDYDIYDLNVDINDLNDKLLLSLLDGTTHNYTDIYKGETKLIDDVFLTRKEIEK